MYKRQSLGYQRDDEGDHISSKNPYFCELTGLYWAWKNLNVDYVGLVHYRRYFTLSHKYFRNERKKFEHVITLNEIQDYLDDYDVILPKKRKYYIESLYSHYQHTLYIEPLDITGDIIAIKYPKYMKEFDALKHRRSGHMFNMCIMKKEILDGYCEWLFDILFELEKRIDFSQYDAFHARFFGRISELLFDVYLRTNHFEYKELRVLNMQNINWIKKGLGFLSCLLYTSDAADD